jgi:hypothetical protein
MIAGGRNLVPALGVPRAACQPRQPDRKPQAARLGHACPQPPEGRQRGIGQALQARQVLRAGTKDQLRGQDRATCRPPGLRGQDASGLSLLSSVRWPAGL